MIHYFFNRPTWSVDDLILCGFTLNYILCGFYVKVIQELKNIDYYTRFWFNFRVDVFTIFATSKEKGPIVPNGPYISTSQTKIRNVCLTVI